MKKIGMYAIGALLSLGMAACTNDEGDPEFEILNPGEDETQKALQFSEEKDSTSAPAGH